MDVFKMREHIINEYAAYVRGFMTCCPAQHIHCIAWRHVHQLVGAAHGE